MAKPWAASAVWLDGADVRLVCGHRPHRPRAADAECQSAPADLGGPPVAAGTTARCDTAKRSHPDPGRLASGWGVAGCVGSPPAQRGKDAFQLATEAGHLEICELIRRKGTDGTDGRCHRRIASSDVPAGMSVWPAGVGGLAGVHRSDEEGAALAARPSGPLARMPSATGSTPATAPARATGGLTGASSEETVGDIDRATLSKLVLPTDGMVPARRAPSPFRLVALMQHAGLWARWRRAGRRRHDSVDVDRAAGECLAAPPRRRV